VVEVDLADSVPPFCSQCPKGN